MTLDININLRADNSLLDLLQAAASRLSIQPQAAPAALPAPATTENPTPGAGSAPVVPTAAPAVPQAGPTSAYPSSPTTGNTPPTAPQMPAVPVAAPAAPVSSAPPAPAVPTTPAPGYTLDQLSKAGAGLTADPAKREQLIALLRQFGVPAITMLPPEQYGAFATALRGLGAVI